jgi:hypothetical protein
MADPTVYRNGYVAFSTSTGSTTFVEVDANKTLEIPFSKAELPDGVMGDTLEVSFPGLMSAPVSLVHRQDFGAAGIDKKFWDLWNNGNAFQMKWRPVDAAVSTTNPSYKLTKVRVFGITPISGSHGQLLENAVTMRAGSGCTLVRSTST